MTIANTQSEIIVANGLRAIRDLATNQATILNDRYNTLKAYVLANATQLDAADRTKLNALQTDITSIVTDLNTLVTTINTDFPGLS